MANKTLIEYFDDLTGKPVESDDVHTVQWSWAGVDYSIDLSTQSLERVEAGKVSIATLLKKSTRIGRRRRSPATKLPTRAPRRSPRAATTSSTADIRQWAREQGFDVADRGRIHQDITAAYAARK